MGLVSLPIGASNSGTNDWADVNGEDQAIVDVVNGNIENVNIKASAGIEDSKLASPNNSVYKTIFQSRAVLAAGLGSGQTYLLGSRGPLSSGSLSLPWLSGSTVDVVDSTYSPEPPDIFYFDNDDFTVGSKTQKLRLRAQVAVNATAPGVNVVVGLYPLTVAGAAQNINFTVGSVVSSSSVTFTTPSSSTITSGVNSDFTVPSDGAFCLAATLSGSMSANSALSVHAQLQTRNV